jgi:phosphopantothenoylcysteine decarboxylase / phosphopantothenate---cysteine ligase
VRLLLGVSGGIAAYKAVEAARLAVKRGHSVRVIQTPTSQRFVGAATFQAITGAPVLTGEFEDDPARGSYPGESVPEYLPISHLALVERADVYLIAPASANTIAKLAHGHADNLLSTSALAAGCPVVVAPAMNDRMYRHPATQANLETLSARGVIVLPPGVGELASHGERGIGRLPEPPELIDACEQVVLQASLGGGPPGPPQSTLSDTSMSGLRVLVTAGGTQEPIDSVRFIGNRSSGRMGYALAARAAARGAHVTVVAANVKLPEPPQVEVVPVHTAAELQTACEDRFDAADVLLMAAAVADFRPADPAAHKLKKTGAQALSTLRLEPTADILSALAERRRTDQMLVGFAAEHGDGAVAYGREKLARKRLDAIVVNDISDPAIGFDSSENEVVIIARDGAERKVAKTAKDAVAEAVLDEVLRLREAVGGRLDGAELSTARS